MLSYANRLPKERIHDVFSTGKRYFSPIVTLYLGEHDSLTAQFAVVVGKRAAKLATQRNRIKRLLRHSLRSFIPKLIKPVAGIIIVQHTPQPLTQEAMDKIVLDILMKAHIYKE